MNTQGSMHAYFSRGLTTTVIKPTRKSKAAYSRQIGDNYLSQLPRSRLNIHVYYVGDVVTCR